MHIIGPDLDWGYLGRLLLSLNYRHKVIDSRHREFLEVDHCCLECIIQLFLVFCDGPGRLLLVQPIGMTSLVIEHFTAMLLLQQSCRLFFFLVGTRDVKDGE